MNIICLKKKCLLLFFAINYFSSFSQKIFYCDSINLSTQAVGICAYYYNFLNESVDSFPYMIEDETEHIQNRSIFISAPLGASGKIDGLVTGRIDTNTIFKVFYNEGRPHGRYVEIRGGDTLGYVNLVQGKKEGLQIYRLFEGSNEVIKQTYINGLLEGMVTIENTYGIFRIINYKGGLRHGADYALYYDGTIEWLIIYENGKIKDGTYHTFFKDGTVESEITYEKNRKIKYVRYGNNGEILLEENF